MLFFRSVNLIRAGGNLFAAIECGLRLSLFCPEVVSLAMNPSSGGHGDRAVFLDGTARPLPGHAVPNGIMNLDSFWGCRC